MGQTDTYLLLDSSNFPLAHGRLENDPDCDELRIRVLDGKVAVVLEHELLQLVGMSPDTPPLLGRIMSESGGVVILKKQQVLGEDVRQNLRIPVRFDTFIYPVGCAWRGRRKVESHDLSCGGIAFFCDESLIKGEHVEVVIPITPQPLILCCQVLRERPSVRGTPLYAAKFIDMCNDEEAMIREAVFSVQLEQNNRF